MAPKSLDLRQSVLKAYDAGERSFQALARRFFLSASAVSAWVRRRDSTGSLVARSSPGSSSARR